MEDPLRGICSMKEFLVGFLVESSVDPRKFFDLWIAGFLLQQMIYAGFMRLKVMRL